MKTPQIHNANLQAAVRAHLQKTNESQNAFAKRAAIAPPTLSAWLAGSYAGAVSKIETAIDDALKAGDMTNRLAPPQPMETVVTEATHDTLSHALETDTMVVIHGRAGVGKSVALETFAKANSRAHLIKLTPETASTGGLRRAVWLSVGAPNVERGHTTYEAIVGRLSGSERLLILDDAHLLTLAGWAWLVGLHDKTRVGIALVGNPEILQSASHLEQWFTRLGMITEVAFPITATGKKSAALSAVADYLADHWLRGFESARAELREPLREVATKTRNLRDVEQILRAVRRYLRVGSPPSEAIAVAVAAKKFPFTFKTITAASPLVLEGSEVV